MYLEELLNCRHDTFSILFTQPELQYMYILPKVTNIENLRLFDDISHVNVNAMVLSVHIAM